MKCKICGNESDNKVFSVKEMMYGIEEIFKYFQCAKCGTLQIENVPENMAKYYPDNYYSYKSLESSPIYKDKITRFTKSKRDYYAVTGKGLTGRVLSFFSPRREFAPLSGLNLNKQSKILDVGCGSGSKLYSLANAGFKNVLGIDTFVEKDINYKIGFNVEKKNLQDVTGKWELIMFNHSFEHLENPDETLRQINNLLSDNGICLIRIPLSDSYAFKKYKENWVSLDAPRHFFLHTVKGLNLLTEKNGLLIKKVVYEGDEFQFWGSEQYIKGITLTAENSYASSSERSIFSKSEIDEFKKLSQQLNSDKQGDVAAFYIQKKNLP